MNEAGELRTIWFDPAAQRLMIIDQTLLPHQLRNRTIDTLEEACEAIETMQVRGAPLIGIMAAFGLYFALRDQTVAAGDAYQRLLATRPTAVNLQWALQRVMQRIKAESPSAQPAAALAAARELLIEDEAACSAIGDHGLSILQALWQKRKREGAEILNVLTHCNAGWLATAAWGTALAPVYKAWQQGIPVHVWVDETRPRNQGASLTAWELGQKNVPHTVIVDNAGGHLMQQGHVDICLVGSDRTSANGDVCNKIGTYLKALAAHDNNIPFYAALPVSTIDFSLFDGVRDIPIEQRDAREVTHIQGTDSRGELAELQLTPPGTQVSNYGFDVTPGRLISGLITEQGLFSASAEGLRQLQARLSGGSAA